MIGSKGIILQSWLNAWNSVKNTLGVEFVANRDISNGYPSLSGFALKLKNAAGTITSTVTHAHTASRVVTIQNKTQTLAALDDINAEKILVAANGSNGLFLNGSCQDGTNKNYTARTYNGQADRPVGSNGFFYLDTSGFASSDNFMAVNPYDVFELSITSKLLAGTNGTPLIGLAQYDADQQLITSTFTTRFAASDTTLAADLSVGDTVISLTSSTGWKDFTTGGGSVYALYIQFFTYHDSFGYVYERSIEPFTKYSSLVANPSTPTWNTISGNNLVLNVPWNYPNPDRVDGKWLAGTKVSNGSSSGTFTYNMSAGGGFSSWPLTWSKS